MMEIYPVVDLYNDKMQQHKKDVQYISLEYNEDFYSSGDCKLTLPLDSVALSIKEGMYIHLPSEYRPRTALINALAYSEGNTDTVTIFASSAKCIAKRRVNLRPSNDAIALLNYGYDSVPLVMSDGDTIYKIPAESVLKTYAKRHMTDPEDPARKISELKIANDLKRGESIAWMAKHGANLAETLESISKYSNMGYHIYLSGSALIFDVMIGKDRSRAATPFPVVFGISSSTANNSLYEKEDGDFKNLAYAEGDVLETGLSAMLAVSRKGIPSGIDRREIFVNAASGGMIESDTEFSYEQIALQELSKYSKIERASADIIAGGDYQYLKDWDLGDIVTIESYKFGYAADVRITGVSENYSASGASIKPTFGDSPNIRKLLKNSIQKIRSN